MIDNKTGIKNQLASITSLAQYIISIFKLTVK